MFEGSASSLPAAEGNASTIRSATDILCPMYARVEECLRFVSADIDGDGGGRPLILCEYSHAMGNSNGSLDKYWELFRDHPRCQGGFVWDWVDQGLLTSVPVVGGGAGAKGEGAAEVQTWGYGGDFTEPLDDGNFCINGVVWPDRAPHPAMEEVRRLLFLFLVCYFGAFHLVAWVIFFGSRVCMFMVVSICGGRGVLSWLRVLLLVALLRVL